MKLPDEVIARYRASFGGAEPSAGCRVPGRVNLIGEHIDYNGLSVLPMAIDRGLYVAFGPRDDGSVHAANTDERYPPASFEIRGTIEPAAAGDWSNYVRAAVQALKDAPGFVDFGGMNLAIQGDLPAGAGLSSSSAVVTASALAALSCVGGSLDDATRKELAETLAEGERYVGTASGGMDHAAILLGQAGHALKIDFEPLRIEPVPMPDSCAIVVCHSGVEAQKSDHARDAYNRGPAYCGIIRAMIEKHAQSDFGDDIEFETLGEIWHGPLCLTHAEAAGLFEAAIAKDTYSLAEAAAILEMEAGDVHARWLDGITETPDVLPLRAWARHQYQEFRRVERLRDALLTGDLEAVGDLMRASHASCSNELGVSTPLLDALAAAAIEHGAYGARLTGAGFGGCTVNLVPQDGVDAFRNAVWQSCYKNQEAGKRFARMDDAIFEVRPAAGADYV
jgi:galactokinase